MKLYHGSNLKIENINLDKSKKGKDFGRGFYLSDNYSQAYKMACLTTDRLGFGSPIVSEYDFDESCLEDCSIKVKKFDEYTEEWAQFILDNRTNELEFNIHNYDIVIGPIADDKVGYQIRRFIYGDITVKQLISELKYRKGLSIQYLFATDVAIKLLNSSK